MKITCEHPWLGIDLGAMHRVISWAVHRPGLVHARRILWREVRNADLTPDLDVARWLAAELETRDASDAVCLLTSRDVRAHHHAEAVSGEIRVEALATVGLSNSEAVGARVDRRNHDWGTINVAVQLHAALGEPALLEALSIAAQARTAAVMDAGFDLPTGRATGTGTDCIALAAQSVGSPLLHAGMHTDLGEALGRAVRDAVAAGAEEWMTTVRRP